MVPRKARWIDKKVDEFAQFFYVAHFGKHSSTVVKK